jgi:hypothetical protein
MRIRFLSLFKFAILILTARGFLRVFQTYHSIRFLSLEVKGISKNVKKKGEPESKRLLLSNRWKARNVFLEGFNMRGVREFVQFRLRLSGSVQVDALSPDDLHRGLHHPLS